MDNENIKVKKAKAWDDFASTYNEIDSFSLAFLYTLINMLQLSTSKHILEVACGTGKMLPQAVLLKPDETTYLAIDLSSAMI